MCCTTSTHHDTHGDLHLRSCKVQINHVYSPFLDELVSIRSCNMVSGVGEENSGGYDSSEISLNWCNTCFLGHSLFGVRRIQGSCLGEVVDIFTLTKTSQCWKRLEFHNYIFLGCSTATLCCSGMPVWLAWTFGRWLYFHWITRAAWMEGRNGFWWGWGQVI